jgi:hypothetical protein
MDNIDIDVPAREAKQGVVYCVAGSWTMNVVNGQFGTVNIPTIGGISAKTIRYQFLKRSLYKIDVLFNKQGTQDLLNGLQAKYGQPTVSDLAHFENKYGAKFDTFCLSGCFSVEPTVSGNNTTMSRSSIRSPEQGAVLLNVCGMLCLATGVTMRAVQQAGGASPYIRHHPRA